MLTKREKSGWDAIDEAAERADGYLAIPITLPYHC